jgi:hypothetical protein
MTAFWSIAPCSLVEVDRRFRGAYCLHYQVSGDRQYTYLKLRYTSTRLNMALYLRRLAVIFILVTESSGRVVNTPASYSGGPRFKSRPGDRLSWLRFFVVFSIPPGECRESTLKIRPRSLPTKSFQIHHYSLVTLSSTLYGLVTEKAS